MYLVKSCAFFSLILQNISNVQIPKYVPYLIVAAPFMNLCCSNIIPDGPFRGTVCFHSGII